MSFDWNPFRLATGEFVRFDEIGDEVVGKIVNIRRHTFDKEKGPVPLIDLEPLDGGDVITLPVDRVDLRVKITEIEPQVGDLLAVKYTGKEKVPGSPNPKKVFAIKHKVGERPATQPALSDTDPFSGPDYPPGEEPF